MSRQSEATLGFLVLGLFQGIVLRPFVGAPFRIHALVSALAIFERRNMTQPSFSTGPTSFKEQRASSETVMRI
jgi:hypothetical protein